MDFSCCFLLNFDIRNIVHCMKNVKRRVQLIFISWPTEQLWQGRLSAEAIQWPVAVFQNISFIENSHFTSGISISIAALSLPMSPFTLLQPSQRKIYIYLVSDKAQVLVFLIKSSKNSTGSQNLPLFMSIPQNSLIVTSSKLSWILLFRKSIETSISRWNWNSAVSSDHQNDDYIVAENQQLKYSFLICCCECTVTFLF